jgi:DNA polymerase-3 subunit epsilon
VDKHNLNLKRPLVVFDLEATGTNITTDRIVEVCFLKAFPGGDYEIKTYLINPEMKIPDDVIAIHGITNEMVKDAPVFKQLARQFEQYLEGCDLAGYNNMKFDLPLLMEEFLKAEIDFNLANRRIIDAQKIFFLMEPRTLSAAFRFYCDKELSSIGKAHSAETDTIATFYILNEQVKKYENTPAPDGYSDETFPVKNDMDALHKISALNNIDLAGRITRNVRGEIVFNFGKHKDKVVEQVLKNEPSYYEWIMKGDFPLDTKRKITEIKLSMNETIKVGR